MDITFVPESDGSGRFCMVFVNMLIAWNHVEDQARGLLASLMRSNGSVGGFVAIRSLGNTSLTTALQAVAEYEDEPKREHLLHFVKCMDGQRAFRNYYVHTLHGIGESAGKETGAGILNGWDVKGAVHHVQDYVTIEDLEKLGLELEQLRLYAIRINWALRNHPDNRLYEAARQMDTDPWPEKPPLPKKLAKRRRRG